jgi:hypothetical protein
MQMGQAAYDAAAPHVTSAVQAGQDFMSQMQAPPQQEGPTLGTADGSIPDITQAAPGEVEMSQMSPEQKAQAARALYNQGKGMFQNLAGMAGRGLSGAGEYLQSFGPQQPQQGTGEQVTGQPGESTGGGAGAPGAVGGDVAGQPGESVDPYADSRFREQLNYWNSIRQGDAGTATTRGNIINDRMKGRADRMMNYYTGLDRRGQAKAQKLRAQMDAGEDIGDTGKNYLARMTEFETGADPNAFNSGRSDASADLLHSGLRDQLAAAKGLYT